MFYNVLCSLENPQEKDAIDSSLYQRFLEEMPNLGAKNPRSATLNGVQAETGLLFIRGTVDGSRYGAEIPVALPLHAIMPFGSSRREIAKYGAMYFGPPSVESAGIKGYICVALQSSEISMVSRVHDLGGAKLITIGPSREIASKSFCTDEEIMFTDEEREDMIRSGFTTEEIEGALYAAALLRDAYHETVKES